VINHPGRYRAELVETDGASSPLTVLAVDVVHDLAIVKSGLRGKPHFTLGDATPAQGQRLFSLGHPLDLGLSIVEGTYQGLVQNSLYPRIHLTAPISPGMSGGPTIDESGRVVGVNVATAGQEVGFLVPVSLATALLGSALAHDSSTRPTLAQVGQQLRANQAATLTHMLERSTPTLTLGPFRVITQPAPFFNCWGDADRSPDQPYEIVTHQCSTEDDIYLGDGETTGSFEINHVLLSTHTLNAARFYSLYSSRLGGNGFLGVLITGAFMTGSDEVFTGWDCVTRNVDNGSVRLRAVTCLRRYKKLGDLYDATVKYAVLGRSNVGLISTLTISGATYANVASLTQRFLESVTWR